MSRMARNRTKVLAWCLLAAATGFSCDINQPQLVLGPATFDNNPPEFQFLTPTGSFAVNQGERFQISWADNDPDSAAVISFALVRIDSGTVIPIVSNIPENDTAGSDQFLVNTSLVPLGLYYLRAQITDGINDLVEVFATVTGTTTRVQVNIGEPGTNPLSVPPRVFVAEPSFNQGVAQDDTLSIIVFPRDANPTEAFPYDPDSDADLYIVLDFDEDPENDDPADPDPQKIIVLEETTIEQGTFNGLQFDINVDLAVIPQRVGGEPYYIRATIQDPGNPPVHDYADGTINIVRSATGSVDLIKIGTELSGARFQGFNPKANLGSKMESVSDFDGDGVDDFMLIAQFGNPRGVGNVGEAYLIYGLDNARFGGSTNVNTVSAEISGTVFQGPPSRLDHLHAAPEFDPRGITDVAILPDVSGDGRPELLFGMSMADGIYTGRDDDPADSAAVQTVVFTLREGIGTRTINGVNDPNFTGDNYEGTFDTYIDAQDPTSEFGNEVTLDISGVDDTINQWAIIGFENVFGQFVIRADRDAVTVTSATLEIGPFFAGASDLLTVSQMVRFVDEETVYADFADGEEPGPEDEIDFEEELEISQNVVSGFVEVDVTETIQKLLDGELETAFPTWIIRPNGERGIAFSFDSSEAEQEFARPRLTVRTQEPLPSDFSNYNCYPDGSVNNRSDPVPQASQSPPHDTVFESLGAVAVFNSENRDTNDVNFNPDRLESTAVPIELIGMANPPFPLPGRGGRFTGLLDYPDERQLVSFPVGANDGGRTRGARIQAGWWDFYNTSFDQVGRSTPRADYFGQSVAWMPDLTNDGVPEVLISAPRNELAIETLSLSTEESDSRTLQTSSFSASIRVMPGSDFGSNVPVSAGGAQIMPWQNLVGVGSCASPGEGRGGIQSRSEQFDIFAEDMNDFLGGADYAGDVNLDSVPDIICGAPRNDHPSGLTDTGAVYLIYGRPAPGNIELALLDDPVTRPPTLRLRGEKAGDRLGEIQGSAFDLNGDRVDDVFFASPTVDFGGVTQSICGDIDENGIIDGNDLDVGVFNACRASFGDEVFLDDSCKPYDYDNDRDIDDEDRSVFDCLVAGFSDCCPVDNGFVGVIFGNVQLDGDREMSQIASSDLPGVKFFGARPGDRAGADVVSSGDFNRDGFGDLLIAAPGVRFIDSNGRDRMGLAYLVFGGTHLNGNRSYSLDQVGTDALPGVIFWTPFFAGRPNEAPIDHVGFLGDINGDGFDDIGLGITRADFIDSTFPQNPNDPGTNPNIGRRIDDGNVYIIYGNNTGSNR